MEYNFLRNWYLFNIFRIIIIYTNNQFVNNVTVNWNGSVTENITKQSFASERMQAAAAHLFVVDFCLQTTSTVDQVQIVS